MIILFVFQLLLRMVEIVAALVVSFFVIGGLMPDKDTPAWWVATCWISLIAGLAYLSLI